MYCYYQDQHARPDGACFVAPVAVGVCHQCGVAVCAEHAHKNDCPGTPLAAMSVPSYNRKRALQFYKLMV